MPPASERKGRVLWIYVMTPPLFTLYEETEEHLLVG